MKLAQLFLVSLALVCLAGCESGKSLSTMQDEHTAYAITGADAKHIVDSSLENYVPARGIDTTPKAGLVATGSLSDGANTQIFSVSAFPVSGVNSAGQIKDGYGFVVTERGGVVNPLASKMIYGLVKQQALIAGEVLATSKPQQ